MHDMSLLEVRLPSTVDAQLRAISNQTGIQKSRLMKRFLFEGMKGIGKRLPSTANVTSAEYGRAFRDFGVRAKEAATSENKVMRVFFFPIPLMTLRSQAARAADCTGNDLTAFFIKEGLALMAERIKQAGDNNKEAKRLANKGQPRFAPKRDYHVGDPKAWFYAP